MEISNMVTEYLTKFNIDVSSVGFEYLQKAIEICYENEDMLSKVTAALYPMIGDFFGVKGSMVERTIRCVIEKSFKLGGMLEINEVLNCVLYNNEYKFSNGEFISIIVKLMKFDILKEKMMEKYNIEI